MTSVNNISDPHQYAKGSFTVSVIEGGFNVYCGFGHQASILTDRDGLLAMREEIDKALVAPEWEPPKPPRPKTMAERDAEFHAQPRPFAFVPCESLFHYRYARREIERRIPDRPVLVLNDNSCDLDSVWANMLLCDANLHDAAVLRERFALAEKEIQYTLPNDLHQFLSRVADQMTLVRINQHAHRHDIDIEMRGGVTYRKFWRHMLGIEPCWQMEEWQT